MIPFSSSGLIRLHSNVISAVFSLVSFLSFTLHTHELHQHQAVSKRISFVCRFLWSWFSSFGFGKRFVDILDGTVGLGSTKQELL